MAKDAQKQRLPFGERLIAAMTQAAEAFESGDPASHPGVTVRVVEVPDAAEVCDVEVREPPAFDAGAISALRREFGLSQESFARVVGHAPATIRRWERGQSRPSPTARRLMDLLRASPEPSLGRIVRGRRNGTAPPATRQRRAAG